MKLGAILASGLLLLGGGWLIGHAGGRARPRPQPQRQPQDEDVALREATQRRVIGVPIPVAVAAPPNVVAAAPAPPAATPAPRRLSSDAPRYRSFLRDAFARERVDPSWSQASQQRLQVGLGKGTDTRSRLESIDCRSSLCMAELVHDGDTSYWGFVGRTVHVGLWDGPAFFSKDGSTAEGGTKMVMFFGRDGTELPDAELTDEMQPDPAQ